MFDFSLIWSVVRVPGKNLDFFSLYPQQQHIDTDHVGGQSPSIGNRPDSFLKRSTQRRNQQMKHMTSSLRQGVDKSMTLAEENNSAGKAGWPDSPTLRLKELIKLLRVSRSKAYELMKTDPDFPKGIPLYDSELSPKFYWTHEAMAWVEGRAVKFRRAKEEK
ncbi:AlpA family phage regulatory protein [Stenotrophomonas sp. FSL W7-1447]